jgi:serine/threonine protein kinase
VSRRRTGSSSHRDDAKTIGQWRIGRTIGKGSSGKSSICKDDLAGNADPAGRVKIAKHSITGKYAAIKIVPKGAILTSRLSVAEAGARADKVMLGIEREIVIMKLIDHPNVLNLYDVWETSSELYLIMEYVPGGELFDYLVKRGRLPVSEALHYFQQIIYAVDYCHRFNICHRDLKPENLLLDKDKNIKVADFGMAAWEAGERMLETSCGSPHYASPEIVAGKAYHGNASDIWSCGIILFALLTGRLPFDDDNIRSLLQKVKVGVFEMPDEIKGDARDLLRKMLEKDPERRITVSRSECDAIVYQPS